MAFNYHMHASNGRNGTLAHSLLITTKTGRSALDAGDVCGQIVDCSSIMCNHRRITRRLYWPCNLLLARYTCTRHTSPLALIEIKASALSICQWPLRHAPQLRHTKKKTSASSRSVCKNQALNIPISSKYASVFSLSFFCLYRSLACTGFATSTHCSHKFDCIPYAKSLSTGQSHHRHKYHEAFVARAHKQKIASILPMEFKSINSPLYLGTALLYRFIWGSSVRTERERARESV